MKQVSSVWAEKIHGLIPVMHRVWPAFFVSLLVFAALSRWSLPFIRFDRGYLEIGLITLALFSLLWISRSSLRRLQFPPVSFWFLLMFIFWAGFTALWSPVWVKTLGKAYVLLAVVCIALLMALYVKEMHGSLAWVTLFSLTAVVFLLFVLNIQRWGEFFFPTSNADRQGLTLGTEHPNGAAGYLAALAILGLDRAFAVNETKKKRFLAAGIALFFLFLLIFTSSRTGIFASILAIGLFLLFRFRLTGILKISAGLGLAVFVIFLLLLASGWIQPFWQSFAEQNEDIATLNTRTVLWQMSFEEITRSPFGIGYFATWQFFQSKTLNRFNFDWAYHAHNAFVEVLLTTGYLGAILSALFLAAIAPALGRAYEFPLVSTLAAYIFLDSITEVNLFAPTILMYLFCVFIFSVQTQNVSLSGMVE